MRTIVIRDGNCVGLPDVDCLERIYKDVRLNELVKFRGKVFRRIVPKNNKSYKYPYHFWCVSQDIYAGSSLTEDSDGEYVNILCNCKLVLQDEGGREI